MEEKFKFKDLKYLHPDFKKFQEYVNEVVKKIKGAATYDEVKKYIFEYQEEYKKIYEQYTLAFIRRYQDCTDEYYKKEGEYCDAEFAMLDTSVIAKALLESPYVNDINEEFGKEYLAKVSSDMKVHAKGKDLQAKDNELVAKYQQLKATLVVEYDGKKLSEGEIGPYLNCADRKVRRESREALYKAYLSKKKEFIELLDELIKVRNDLAKANGYSSYPEYMDEEKGRRGYGEKELNAFCEEVRKVIVPFMTEIRKRQARELKLDKLEGFDCKTYFLDGSVKPVGDNNYLLKSASVMYHGLSEEAGDFFDDMVERELIDSEGSPNKISGMGFMTELPVEGKSFIFANNNGESSDVEVVTHEVGHAYALYKSMQNHKLYEYYYGTNDTAEIPSMTMEYFAYPYLKGFVGDAAEKYKIQHMCEAFDRICMFCYTNLFENYLYNNPNATFEERVKEDFRLYSIYKPGVDYSCYDEYIKKGVFIFSSMPVYMFPKYVISYSLSEIGAMSFMQRFSEDREKAWNDYVRFCKAGGSKPYPELLKVADLEVPFNEGVVERATEYLRKLIIEMY